MDMKIASRVITVDHTTKMESEFTVTPKIVFDRNGHLLKGVKGGKEEGDWKTLFVVSGPFIRVLSNIEMDCRRLLLLKYEDI